jgi:hypothetical protein
LAHHLKGVCVASFANALDAALRLIDALFAAERQAKELSVEERLRLRQASHKRYCLCRAKSCSRGKSN